MDPNEPTWLASLDGGLHKFVQYEKKKGSAAEEKKNLESVGAKREFGSFVLSKGKG